MEPCRYQILVEMYSGYDQAFMTIGVNISRSYKTAIEWLIPRLREDHKSEASWEPTINYTFKNKFEIVPLDDGPFVFKWQGGEIDDLEPLLNEELEKIGDQEVEYIWSWEANASRDEIEIADEAT